MTEEEVKKVCLDALGIQEDEIDLGFVYEPAYLDGWMACFEWLKENGKLLKEE